MDMQEPSYEELSSLVDSLRTKISDLKSTIDDMQDDIDEKARDISDHEDTIDELNDQIESLKSEWIIFQLKEALEYYNSIWHDDVKDRMLLEKVKSFYSEL